MLKRSWATASSRWGFTPIGISSRAFPPKRRSLLLAFTEVRQRSTSRQSVMFEQLSANQRRERMRCQGRSGAGADRGAGQTEDLIAGPSAKVNHRIASTPYGLSYLELLTRLASISFEE